MDQCYEFWVIDVILSSFESSRNDENLSFKITSVGNCVMCMWDHSLVYCAEYNHSCPHIVVMWLQPIFFLFRKAIFFPPISFEIISKNCQNYLHIQHNKRALSEIFCSMFSILTYLNNTCVLTYVSWNTY